MALKFQRGASKGSGVKIQFFVMLFLGACLLSSCDTGKTTVNREISAVKLAAIRSGITTKDQVRALFGAPQSSKTQLPVRQPPGISLPAKYTASEIWAFWTDTNNGSSIHLPFFARHSAEKPPFTIIIYFDERGTVLDCETSGDLPQ